MQTAFQRWKERTTSTDIVMWAIGFGILVLIIVGSIKTLVTGLYEPHAWFSTFITGIVQGSIYALIAMGYTLVYGVLRMINFAHSEVFMSGPYTAYYVAAAFERHGLIESHPFLSLAAIFVISMFISSMIAFLLERIAYRPLRNAPRLIPLITAIGASFFLMYFFRGLYGTGFQAYPVWHVFDGKWTLYGDYKIGRMQVLVIVAATILMIALYAFIQKTKIGKAIRSVSEDKEAASLMGINVDNSISATFIVGGAAAGAAGVLYALMFKQVFYMMGFTPGIKAFTAAVLGGIGNIPGAMVGGVFLGLIEHIGPMLFLNGFNIPAPYQLKDGIAFTVLVLVLIFRPTGILGEQLTVKKA